MAIAYLDDAFPMCFFRIFREVFGDLTPLPPQPYIGIYAFRREWGKLVQKLPKSSRKIHNCMGFSLVDPDNSAYVLARLTRNYVIDTVDRWDVAVYHPEVLPFQLVKIFAAFVCDTQNEFKRDR